MIKNKNVGKCFYERNISDVFALLEWKYERLFQNNIVECFFAFLYQQFAVCEQICSYFEVNVCDRFFSHFYTALLYCTSAFGTGRNNADGGQQCQDIHTFCKSAAGSSVVGAEPAAEPLPNRALAASCAFVASSSP